MILLDRIVSDLVMTKMKKALRISDERAEGIEASVEKDGGEEQMNRGFQC